MNEELKLYSFFWDCGRMGNLDGLFIATEKQVQDAIGEHVYFGEVLGKHSEIFGTLDYEDVQIVSEDQEKVAWLLATLGETVSGFNPLIYIREHE